jgi:hypothetical protein
MRPAIGLLAPPAKLNSNVNTPANLTAIVVHASFVFIAANQNALAGVKPRNEAFTPSVPAKKTAPGQAVATSMKKR